MKKTFPILIVASAISLLFFLTRTHPPAPPNLGAPASLPAAPPSLRSPLSTLPSPGVPPVQDGQAQLASFFTLHSVRSLSKTLTRDQLAALYKFLSVTNDQDTNQLGHALKSDLMDALCAQTTLPIDLTQLLIQIFHDHTQNDVIRDYALQHLATIDEKLAPRPPVGPVPPPGARAVGPVPSPGAHPVGPVPSPGGPVPPPGVPPQIGPVLPPWPPAEITSQRAAIATILSEALTETDSSIAGTALLSLHRTADPQTTPDTRLTGAALKLAHDPNTGLLARITALQICAEREMKEALPLLTQTASTDPDLSTRISAIGALGKLGGRDEIPLLEKISAENNPRLKPALELALHRVEQRLAHP